MWIRFIWGLILLPLVLAVPVRGQGILDIPLLPQAHANFGRGAITALTWSISGQYLAVTTSVGVFLFDEFQSDSHPIALDHYAHSVSTVAFNPDDRWLVIGSADETVHVWDIEARSEVAVVEAGAWVRSIVFSPDGLYMLVIRGLGFPEGIRVWNTASWQDMSLLAGGVAWGFNFTPEGMWLLTDPGAGLATGDSYEERIHFEEPIYTPYASFSPSGHWLAVADSFNQIFRVWNLDSGEAVLSEANRVVHQFSADDRYLIIMTDEDIENGHHAFALINLETMARQEIQDDSARLNWLIPQTNFFLYTSGSDVHLRDIDTGDIHILPNAIDDIGMLVPSPGGDFLVSTLVDTSTQVSVWDISTRKRILNYRVEGIKKIEWLDEEWLLISLPNERILQHMPSGNEYTLPGTADLMATVNKHGILAYVEDNHVLVRSLPDNGEPQLLLIP